MKYNSWAEIEIKRTKKEFPKRWGYISKDVLIYALAARLAKLRRENNNLKKLAIARK